MVESLILLPVDVKTFTSMTISDTRFATLPWMMFQLFRCEDAVNNINNLKALHISWKDVICHFFVKCLNRKQ